MAHPTVEALNVFAAFVPYIGGMLSAIVATSRYIWNIAYTWHAFWWGLLFFGFFKVFWLWIIDALGILDMDWFWEWFTTKDSDG